jgi:hypothetical protein
METDVKLDMTEFNRALKQLADVQTRRTYPEFINGQMMMVCIKAIEFTEKADAEKIAHQMGQISRVEKVGKSGRKRVIRKFKTDTSSFAHRLVNWMREKRGEKMIWGNELDQAARRLVASRMKHVAFIKSGWVWAFRDLTKVVVGFKPRLDGKAYGDKKGEARPAGPRVDGIFRGEIENDSLLTIAKRGFSHGNPMPIAVRGLQKALDWVAKDMMDHLAKKLKPDFDKVSAKR